MATQYDPRVGELLALEIEMGRSLPMPASEIVALEDSGYIVDLDTGQVLSRVKVKPTVIGEAWCVVMAAGAGVAP